MLENFLIGTAGSLFAALLIYIFARFKYGWKNWPGFLRIVRMYREFYSSGGLNFFSCRKSYLEFKDHGTASEYLRKTKESIYYIGFWLASGTEQGSLITELEQLLNDGKKVTIVLMDPSSDAAKHCSDYLACSPDEIKNRIEAVIKKFRDLYERLSTQAKKGLAVKLHQVPLSSSAFLIDHVNASGRTLVDIKLYKHSREDGYGIEFHKKGNHLYDRITKSFLLIEEGSTPISLDDVSKASGIA